MEKRKKLLIIAIFIFLFSASISGAYAYWAGTVNPPAIKSDTININIGEATAVDTILIINDGYTTTKTLVPPGQVTNSVDPNSVDVINFKYTINWSSQGRSVADATNPLTRYIRIEVVNIKIGTSSTLGEMNINFRAYWTDPDTLTTYTVWQPSLANYWPPIVINEPIEIDIQITMNEPANKTVYDQVKGKPASIQLKFHCNATPAP